MGILWPLGFLLYTFIPEFSKIILIGIEIICLIAPGALVKNICCATLYKYKFLL